jgi:prepilin-type N-terminal cleavage/methylation domain-containing protein
MELPLRPSSAVPRSRALTLVELLVVVTVIGVLLSLMLTVVGSLRSAAVRVSCLANLHRWSVALIGYADDNRGLTPNAIRAWMVPGTEVLGRTP